MDVTEFNDKLLEGKLSRRQVHKILASVGVTAMTIPAMGRPALADGSDVTLFTWGGYDDENFGAGYTEKFGSPPSFALFSDQPEALAKMRAGFHADVVFPCISKIKIWYDAGVIEPLDTSMLSHWDELVPALTTLPTAVLPDGKPLFAPVDFGQTSIIVRADLAPEYAAEENHTWGIFLDEKYKGRLAMFDAVEDHFNLMAIYLGIDFTDMNDEEIDRVSDVVRQTIPNIRILASDTTTMTQALFSGEIVASAAWNGMMATASGEMEKTGEQGKYVWMKPKEGALTWVCGLTIHPDTKTNGLWEKAHALVDAYLAVDSQHFELTQWGYGVSNANVYKMDDVTEEYLNSIGLTSDVEGYLADGVFSSHQARFSEIVTRYEELLAGF
ncbi:MAG: extracellular solute-binding protein [Alphaproteobacteria bacterium]